MKTLREEFEELDNIKMLLLENEDIKFNDGNYIYYGLNTATALATMFIGGAWYAYQEQHKKLNGLAYRKMLSDAEIYGASFIVAEILDENKIRVSNIDQTKIKIYFENIGDKINSINDKGEKE